MSNDTRQLCQLSIGSHFYTKTGLHTELVDILWEEKMCLIKYLDTNKLDKINIQTPIVWHNGHWRIP